MLLYGAIFTARAGGGRAVGRQDDHFDPALRRENEREIFRLAVFQFQRSGSRRRNAIAVRLNAVGTSSDADELEPAVRSRLYVCDESRLVTDEVNDHA